jgi:hypothetical protein
VPELPLEKEISEVEVQNAIEQIPRIFTKVYPSSGPALYLGSLDNAMKQSLFNLDAVSIFILQTEVFNLI